MYNFELKEQSQVFDVIIVGSGAGGGMAAYQLTKTRAALSDVLWNRLREIQMDCWTSRSESLAFAMAEVFGPALKRGARIVRRGEGLGTLVRRT